MSTSPVVVHKPTSFLTVDDSNRQIAKKGFTHNALEEHLRDHCVNPNKYEDGGWCNLYCAARVFYGRAIEENREQMRKRFSRATAEFIERGLLLLKEYGLRGAITKVKLYDRHNADDMRWAKEQRNLAEEKGEYTRETLVKIDNIIGDSAQTTANAGSLPFAVDTSVG